MKIFASMQRLTKNMITLSFFIRDIKIFGIGLSLNFFSNLHSPVPNFVPYFSLFFIACTLKLLPLINKDSS